MVFSHDSGVCPVLDIMVRAGANCFKMTNFLKSPASAGTAILLAGTLVLTGCAGPARLKYNIDDTVWYEAGSGDNAIQIARFLPEAATIVENSHRQEFKDIPEVYVFASDQGFERASGYQANRVAGVSTPSGLYLAPQNIEPMQRILVHELSHVLLRQWIGSWRFHQLPIWFREGLATWVADGGGAGSVTEAQTILALRAGNSFTPNLKEGMIFRNDAPHWNLSHQMFYRQASLFIDFLARQYSARWQQLLNIIHQGASFPDAYNGAFDQGLEDLWLQFLSHIESTYNQGQVLNYLPQNSDVVVGYARFFKKLQSDRRIEI